MLLIHQRIVPHYQVSVLERVIAELGEVAVAYGDPSESESIRNGEISTNDRFWKVKNFYPAKTPNLFYSGILGKIIGYRPRQVVTVFNLGNLDVYLLFLLRRALKFKLVLWTHGWDRSVGLRPGSIKDKLRLYLMKKSDAVLLYSDGAKRQLARFVDESKLIVARNTLDTESLLAIRYAFLSLGREEIKRRVGFRHKYNLIFVGMISKRKSPALVIEIFEQVQKVLSDTALHFVGDGPLLPSIKEMVRQRGIDHITFHGAVYDDQKLGECLYGSDLLLQPAYLGLSLVHAFCFECPVLSMDLKGHGPEIEYLVDGKTGIFLASANVGEAARAVIDYLQDDERQEAMRRNVVDSAKNEASLDKMLQGFETVRTL